MTIYSQRDPRWADVNLGSSTTTTISSHGCTITSLGMVANINPLEVNNRLKNVNGYAETNKVLWTKVGEAIPWLKFEWRGYTYDNGRAADAGKWAGPSSERRPPAQSSRAGVGGSTLATSG